MADKLSQEEIDEIVSNLDIKVGVGDPSSPYFGQLLSEEDEAKLDNKGEPIVEGDRWGDCSTGMYLVVAVGANNNPFTLLDRKSLGGGTFPFGRVQITVVTTEGKPRFTQTVAGACLELPVDLGRDELKRRYVVEWLTDTAAEALAMNGVDLGGHPGLYKQLGLQVAVTAENAIQGTGL